MESELDLPADDASPAEGTTCATAIDLTGLTSWSGSFSDFADLWDGTTGCRTASGPEAWFTITVPDGNRLTLSEESTSDTVLHLVSSCTTTVCEWSSDEPEVFDVYNDTGGTVEYIFAVERYYSGTTGPIQLLISSEPPAAGFDCENAVDVTSLTTWSGSYTDYADLWDGSTGCLAANGPEVWFTAVVAPGHRFTLEEISSSDVVVHRVSGCGTTTCSFSSDMTEKFDYYNDTAGSVTLFIVVERYYSGSSGPVQVNVRNGPPAGGYTCNEAVDVTSIASWSGSYVDYSDLWDGSTGCLTANGPEVWFTAVVAPGHRFVLEEISTTDVVLHRVSGCGTTTCSFSSDTTEKFDYYNDTAGNVTLFIVVERYYSGSSGNVQVSVSNGPPAEGYTCNEAVDVTSLTSWSGSYADYSDLWDGTTGCWSASGGEVWFTATVPNGNTFAFDEISTTDVVLHRVSGCGTTTCSWSSDTPERFSLTNTTGAAVQVTLVVERYWSGSTGPIQVNVSNLP
jgi:hypothetical protein